MTTPASRPPRRTRPRTVLGMVALVVAAAAAGAVSGFVHRTTVEIAGATLPVGMLAALGALSALVLLARQLGRSRAAVLVVGGVYAVPLLLLSQFRPEGDLVIAEDAWGLTLLAGVALVITLGVAVPFRPYDGPTASPTDSLATSAPSP